VADAGVFAVQRAGRRFVAVALLRHGDRDDAGSGPGEAVEHGGRVLRRHQRFGDRADDAEVIARRITDSHGVEAILRCQGVAGVGAAERDAADPPGTGGPVEAVVGIDGLMGAVKRAEADMDDAGCEASAGTGTARLGDRRRQRQQRSRVQALAGGRDGCHGVSSPLNSGPLGGAFLLVYWYGSM